MNEAELRSYLDTWIPSHKQDIVDCLLRFLRIPSVGTDAVSDKPFGVEVDRAFELYLDEARKAGMDTRNVDRHAVHAEIGQGAETVMALTHVDVVPFGSGWSKDPLGEVSDGMVFGRGAQDNKGPTVACLFALRALKESGSPLARRIRHVVGGNEESGFRCVRRYFEVEPQPTYGFSPDAVFPLVYAEKGTMNVVVTATIGRGAEDSEAPGARTSSPGRFRYSVVEFSGGERANIVAGRAEALVRMPVGLEDRFGREMEQGARAARAFAGGPGPLEFDFTKGSGEVRVVATGKPAHASTPAQGTNAVSALAYLLGTLGEAVEGGQALRFVASASEIHGRGLGIESQDDISGKLSCNLGLAKTEMVGGARMIRCVYNCRYPVKADGEELKQRALRWERPPGVTVDVPNVGRSHYTDPDSHLVKTLLKIYREETGDTRPPMAIGGGTYARVIRGGVAYGPALPGSPEVAHQADERIAIDDLMFLVRIYARAMHALAG